MNQSVAVVCTSSVLHALIKVSVSATSVVWVDWVTMNHARD